MKGLLVLSVLVAVVSARRAPHAEYAETLLRTPGVRYSDNIQEDATLDAPGLIAKYGYPVEVHSVVTSDGYILEAHRIPHGRDANNTPDPNKPVAFIMHGLLSSSADFLVLGPGNAIAYLLAEAGYDVWLGNARGNYYSRRHSRLNPDSILNKNFWRFSWDEIGNLDLPAFIDYILATTGQSKLHYIGHSQGGTSFLVLNSLRPAYNDKFISFQGLAPASFFDNNEVELFNTLAQYENILESMAFTLGYAEIFADAESMNGLMGTFCGEGSLLGNVCGGSIVGLGEREYYNATMIPVFLAHAPAGASVRQIAHYGQVIRTKTFRRYNHGTIQNLSTYGSLNPPTYDLSRITVPAYLYYGLDDREVNHKDLFNLAGRLSNLVELVPAGRDSFNHFDFIWANDVREMLYEDVLARMKDAESKFL